MKKPRGKFLLQNLYIQILQDYRCFCTCTVFSFTVSEITVFDIDERKFNRESEAYRGLYGFAADRANMYVSGRIRSTLEFRTALNMCICCI